jgi:hypothetical protein
MKSKNTLLAAVGGLALLSGSAQAALIGSFDFTTASGWMADGVNSTTYNSATATILDCAAGTTNASNGCGLAFSGSNDVPMGWTTVDWFSHNTFEPTPSGLDIASFAGTLFSNGAWVDTGEITHRNVSLPSPATSLLTLDLLSSFTITDPALGAFSDTFFIEFKESPNQAPCPEPNTLGSICDDWFELSGLPAPIVFVIDGYQYTIEFRLFGGAGFVLAENTLYTREDATNNIFVQARVMARQVPEPATLGILGLGLLLLNRRKLMS